ncbi:hypothetical protein [Aestuariibacter sp. A3R04]|uniref:hypothetical protein n=1 Tax=Aestuariibacter sp. A3R04 TaxID=2841571 RepID=UPI001C09B6C0|nr:hypothetical protein [Aestuariibacter sp. A3R04]MBU3023292.1 hypothetical protein [Aestuariibacter sp. A3R04]
MRKILLLLITLSGTFSATAQQADNKIPSQCVEQQQWMKADFVISEQRADKVLKRSLTLWRKPNVVAHQYAQQQITQMWEHVNQRVKATRFFDAHERAIEYQPGETIHGHTDNNWPYRYQLIKPGFLASLEKTRTEGEGCALEEYYSGNIGNDSVSVVWLPAMKLLKAMTVGKNHREVRWSLQQLAHDQPAIRAFFTKRADFQSTDFADIGDDHTDPFLTNMVHQGFIEPAASGFYDVNGTAIEGSGHSH